MCCSMSVCLSHYHSMILYVVPLCCFQLIVIFEYHSIILSIICSIDCFFILSVFISDRLSIYYVYLPSFLILLSFSENSLFLKSTKVVFVKLRQELNLQLKQRQLIKFPPPPPKWLHYRSSGISYYRQASALFFL